MIKYTYDASGNLIAAIGIVAPQIVRQPVNQIVEPGGIASFSVVIAEAPAVTFQWKFNGADIPGATGDSLLLTNVSAANEGQYSVVAANVIGSVTSEPAALMFDSDGDGLPDNWEITHFGNLTAQGSEGDQDKDGVSNLDEFFDGTIPKRANPLAAHTSLRPRLVVYSDPGGSVTVEPMKLSYNFRERVKLTAAPLAQSVFLGWMMIDPPDTVNPTFVTLNENKTVRARFASAVPIPPGLVACWRGETDANDLVGGHHGVFHAGEEVATPGLTPRGKVGGAFNFEGTVHVRVPDSAALRPAQFTVELWVVPAGGGSDTQTIIAHGSRMEEAAWSLGFFGKLRLRSRSSAGNDLLESPDALRQNRWTHVAFSFDGTSKRLYVNGLEVASKGGLGALVYAPASVPLTIALDIRNSGTRSPFRGQIDEVCLYNRALTQLEIFSIYNADRAGKNFKQPYVTSPSQLPDATLGVEYRHQVTTILGTAPVRFSLAAGMLPPGVTLTPTGVVSGVSDVPGIFDFTVMATDSTATSTERLCILRVL